MRSNSAQDSLASGVMQDSRFGGCLEAVVAGMTVAEAGSDGRVASYASAALTAFQRLECNAESQVCPKIFCPRAADGVESAVAPKSCGDDDRRSRLRREALHLLLALFASALQARRSAGVTLA